MNAAISLQSSRRVHHPRHGTEPIAQGLIMNRLLACSALALVAAPLAACGGNYGVRVAYSVPAPIVYDGWYDGYYGPVHDGYWGTDGYFYFRHAEGEGAFTRGDRDHFVRRPPPGPHNFQPIHGQTAPRGPVRAPHYPGGWHDGHR